MHQVLYFHRNCRNLLTTQYWLKRRIWVLNMDANTAPQLSVSAGVNDRATFCQIQKWSEDLARSEGEFEVLTSVLDIVQITIYLEVFYVSFWSLLLLLLIMQTGIMMKMMMTMMMMMMMMIATLAKMKLEACARCDIRGAWYRYSRRGRRQLPFVSSVGRRCANVARIHDTVPSIDTCVRVYWCMDNEQQLSVAG